MAIYQTQSYKINTYGAGVGNSFTINGSASGGAGSASPSKTLISNMSVGYEMFDIRDLLRNMNVNQTKTIRIYSNNSYITLTLTSVSGSSLGFTMKYFNSSDVNMKEISGNTSVTDAHEYRGFTLGLVDNVEKAFYIRIAEGYSTFDIYPQPSFNYREFLGMSIITNPDPYSTDNNNTPEGGYGDFDYTSEEVLPPSLPSLSAAQVGFVSLWNPTQSEMQALASYLWTGTFDLTNFKKLFTDPMECVLSVGLIPITPTRKQSGGADVKEEIVFGGSSHSGVNAYPVTEQFYIVDMGTLHIGGKSKSAMDYSPYAKASIYLPYCGTYALDVDEIMDSDIELEYHIDIYTGACVAYLTINGHINSDEHAVHSIMYQFTGNVLASIPITGNDHSQFIQSMLYMGAAAAATVATSGAGAGAAAAGADLGAETAAAGFNKALAASAINTVMSMKPNVLHSGNLSSTAGLLGAQKPFVTMTWSNLCRPDDEYKLVGMPLHQSGTLSDFEGFTIVSACHMDNILCTEQELTLIEQALAKGVIV